MEDEDEDALRLPPPKSRMDGQEAKESPAQCSHASQAGWVAKTRPNGEGHLGEPSKGVRKGIELQIVAELVCI